MFCKILKKLYIIITFILDNRINDMITILTHLCLYIFFINCFPFLFSFIFLNSKFNKLSSVYSIFIPPYVIFIIRYSLMHIYIPYFQITCQKYLVFFISIAKTIYFFVFFVVLFYNILFSTFISFK